MSFVHRPEADFTTAKERVSGDKLRSIKSLIIGQRASHFDAFLKEAPNNRRITSLSEQLELVEDHEIHNVIFDLDGTLVAPYSPITEGVIAQLNEFLEAGRKVGIYTNSPHTDRLDILRDNGIFIAETGIPKPTCEGYELFCDKHDMDPVHTAMVGNSPITDMPLVAEGQPSLFPLNILVESIPPQKELVESWVKYYRAWLFHEISVAAAKIVQLRNPNMF